MESESSEPKAGKGQFKCFHCRKIVPNKEGDWHIWNAMEVHLCRTCEMSTRSSQERKANSSK